MKTPTIPDMNLVVEDLGSLFPILTDSVVASIQQTTEFFQSRGKPIDRNAFPHLFRYFLKMELMHAGQQAKEEADTDGLFDEHVLPNNGIMLRACSYDLRIWKSNQGHLPPIGQSKGRRDFCNQIRTIGEQTQLFPGENRGPQPVARNLIVLWDVTDQYDLLRINLVCPKPGIDEDTVEEAWRAPIFYAISPRQDMGSMESPLADIDVTQKVPPEFH